MHWSLLRSTVTILRPKTGGWPLCSPFLFRAVSIEPNGEYILCVILFAHRQVLSFLLPLLSFTLPFTDVACACVSQNKTIGYVSLGGLRSSLVSDAIQACLALVLLFIVIGIIIPKARSDLLAWNPVPSRDVFSLEGGMDLVIVGSLQVRKTIYDIQSNLSRHC